jgi:hypothetical protein
VQNVAVVKLLLFRKLLLNLVKLTFYEYGPQSPRTSSPAGRTKEGGSHRRSVGIPGK